MFVHDHELIAPCGDIETLKAIFHVNLDEGYHIKVNKDLTQCLNMAGILSNSPMISISASASLLLSRRQSAKVPRL